MTLNRLREQLRHHIGAVIQEATVEFWQDELGATTNFISIGITFRNGPTFILSCAGDGGLAVQRRRLGTSSQNLRERSLRQLYGETLVSGEFSNNRLVLATENHRVEICNCDDQLEIMIDGQNLGEAIDRMA